VNTTSRAQLHTMLGHLLDSANTDTGTFDATQFWTFLHVLADGRGIADDLDIAAAAIFAIDGLPDDPDELFTKWQGAILLNVLERLNIKGEGSILPDSFHTASMLAHAHNLSGRKPALLDIFHGPD